jgi:hypothetical protein
VGKVIGDVKQSGRGWSGDDGDDENGGAVKQGVKGYENPTLWKSTYTLNP